MTPTRLTRSPAPYSARAAAAAIGLGLAIVVMAETGTLSAAPGARAVLADPDEPGEPLEVSGTVYESDGKTPAPGTRLVVYHTDARGYYSDNQSREHARLSAEIVTGKDGSYSFRTIMPGYYPGGGTAKHVHYEIKAKDGRQASAEMRFADDPVLSKATLERARQAIGKGDRFFDVRPVERGKDGVKRCAFDLKLPPRPGRAPQASG